MNKKLIKRIYNVVIILFLAGAVAWCFSHFYHGSDVAYTDDAQVNRHINSYQYPCAGIHQGDSIQRLPAREEGRHTRHHRGR